MPASNVCVAGKSRIAIETVKHVLDATPPHVPIHVVCNKTDDGTDGWQPSLRKFASSLERCRIVGLEDAYALDDLLFISVEYDRLLKTGRFRTDRLFNIHFSKLPAYKGMYTSCHPILRGERETGCTLHRIDGGIDTGDIISQTTVPISEVDTCKTLYGKYLDAGIALIRSNYSGLLAGSVVASPQPADGASYYSRASIDYGNLTLDIVQTAFGMRRQVNAFNHRSYQLPLLFSRPVTQIIITGERSTKKPGSVLEEKADRILFSTIDYDCWALVDCFDDLLDAVRSESIATIRRIVENDPLLVEESNERGWTPLIVASYNGLCDSAAALLAAGADPNRSNEKKTTPLMYAKDHVLAGGDPRIMALLLSAGADPHRRDITGKTMMDYADAQERQRLTEIVECRDDRP